MARAPNSARHHIRQREFLAALRAMLAEADSREGARLAYQEYILGPPAILLRAFREAFQHGKLPDLATLLDSADWNAFIACVTHGRATSSAHPLEILTRLGRIIVTAEPASAVFDELLAVVQQFEACWNYKSYFAPALRPTGDNRPPPRPRALNTIGEARVVEALLSGASDHAAGWWNPAVCLVAELWYYIFAPSQKRRGLQHDFQSATWISFAVQSSTQAPGRLGWLAIERIPRGCGAFYPHPMNGALLRTDAVFQEGLQNGWWAEIGRLLASKSNPQRVCEHDFRWSLEFNKPATRGSSHGRPRHEDVLLTDRSLELAVACALRAARLSQRLTENVAVTAIFKEPRTELLVLGPVGRVLSSKAWADGCGPHDRYKRVVRLIVSQDHPEAGQELDDGGLVIEGQPDLDAVFHELSIFELMTRIVNEKLALEAANRLRDQCHAETPDKYVRSPLRREKKSLDRDPEADDHDTLDAAEAERIVIGSHARRLIRFFADSGIGKSMFLVYCELRIAQSQSGLLPVRLDKLGDLRIRPWHDAGQFREMLATSFTPLLPPQYHDSVPRWLDYLGQAGRFVYLLDALDQTGNQSASHQEAGAALGAWLDKVLRQPQSPRVYVTGRHSSRQCPLFDTARWDTLEVGLLEWSQVDEFLGTALAARLRSLFEDDEVLRVPMVLSLIKGLETSPELNSLDNRERIYHAALEWPLDREHNIEGLICKGLRTAKDTPFTYPDLKTIGRVAEILGFAAWTMLRRYGFQEYVEERDYRDLERTVKQFAGQRLQKVDADLMRLLEQINVFNLGTFEHESDFLQWRHLSFCEYCAGVYLAEYLDAAEARTEIAKILDMVAAVDGARQDSRGAAAENSPRERWRWVFRFALSRAHANATNAGRNEQERAATARQRLNQLARDLVAHGAPFVVYEAIDKDHVKLDEELDGACRWLVHQVWDRTDYRPAFKDAEPPTICDATVQTLRDLFRRPYRDSRVLPAAWQLLETRGQADATLLSDQLNESDQQTLDRLLKSFKQCPPDDFQLASATNLWKSPDGRSFVFRMGSLDSDKEKENDEQPPHLVRVDAFELLEFGVSNLAYELFDPGHYFWRDEYSRNDDQPVNWVNWYMADMYARQWLAVVANADGNEYGLPTECEREFAARAGSGSRYFWGDQYDAGRCNAEFSRRRTLGESETTDAYRNAFGLHHMSGNLDEWCWDGFDARWYSQRCAASRLFTLNARPVFGSDSGPPAGSFRVLRGGSFDFLPRYCRSAPRNYSGPDDMDGRIGFRVCRRLSFAQSSSG